MTCGYANWETFTLLSVFDNDEPVYLEVTEAAEYRTPGQFAVWLQIESQRLLQQATGGRQWLVPNYTGTPGETVVNASLVNWAEVADHFTEET